MTALPEANIHLIFKCLQKHLELVVMVLGLIWIEIVSFFLLSLGTLLRFMNYYKTDSVSIGNMKIIFFLTAKLKL